MCKKRLSLLLALLVLLSAAPLTAGYGAAAVNYRIGDVDGDGVLSAGDARLALRASVLLERYKKGSAQFLAADADQNGAIESADARLILRASVKLEQLPEPAGTLPDLTIDGIAVAKDGRLAEGIAQAADHLFWTDRSGGNAYQTIDFGKTAKEVYDLLSARFGADPLADYPLLIVIDPSAAGTRIAYKGGFRIRIPARDTTNPAQRILLRASSLADIAKGMARMFIWAQPTSYYNGDIRDYKDQPWNEDVIADAVGLYALDALKATGATSSESNYVAYLLNTEYPQQPEALAEPAAATPQEFKTLTENRAAYKAPRVRFLYDALKESPKTGFPLLLKLYAYLDPAGYIDYGRWTKEEKAPFLQKLRRIQPAIALKIDGVTVTLDGEPAEGIVKARKNLYWSCAPLDNSYYQKTGFTDLLNAEYDALRKLFGIDPLQEEPLLIRLLQGDFRPSTNYTGGFRIRIHDHSADWDERAAKIPCAVYELGHEMSHFFLWTVKTSPDNRLRYPFQCWTEEVIVESLALLMLQRLSDKVSSPKYPVADYLDYYLRTFYPQQENKLHGSQTMTQEEFRSLSEDASTKANWHPDVRYLYDLYQNYPDSEIARLMNLYDYYDEARDVIDFEKWYKATGSEFVKALSKIQPKIKG